MHISNGRVNDMWLYYKVFLVVPFRNDAIDSVDHVGKCMYRKYLQDNGHIVTGPHCITI